LLAKLEFSREQSSPLSGRHHREPIKDKLTECENSVVYKGGGGQGCYFGTGRVAAKIDPWLNLLSVKALPR
jgi:hypothetical protein